MTRGHTTVKSSIERTVQVKYELAKQGDYLNLLGIDRDDSPDDIRKAYLRWVKMFHPDSLARHGIDHLREKAAQIFKTLSDAYDVFSDEAKKKAWLATLDNGDGAGDAEARTRNEEEEAKIALHQCRLLLRRRAWGEAEALLKKIVVAYPTDARALTLLGWCVFQDTEKPDKKRLQEARDFWEKAVKADGESADAHYHLSLYFKATGNLTQQEKALNKALKNDESYVAAKREMRLLEMRKGQTEDKAETMGDFFKRVWGKLNKKKAATEPETKEAPKASWRKTKPKTKI